MVSERNEGREGQGEREGWRGLKYTSDSSRRYEILLPPSVVGLSTPGLAMRLAHDHRDESKTKEKKERHQQFVSAEFHQPCVLRSSSVENMYHTDSDLPCSIVKEKNITTWFAGGGRGRKASTRSFRLQVI